MKAKKRSVSTVIISILLVVMAEIVMYIFPVMRFSSSSALRLPVGKPDDATQNYMNILESMHNDFPDESQPAKDYSNFIGTWKGYFGEEMSPTYMGIFEDLGFELISCNGSDITYTFWLTGNGISKKLDATAGTLDSNNCLHISIQGERAALTLDLVLEDSGKVWGVVSDASVLGQSITFPVLFFQKVTQ